MGLQPNQVLPPTSKHSPLVTALVNAFKNLQPEEAVSYEQIEELLNLDKSSQLFRYVVSHAIKRVLRDHSIDMVNRRSYGYQRQSPQQTAKRGVTKDVPSIRRKVNRVAEKANTVNHLDPSLDEETRQQALATKLVSAAAAQAVSRYAVDGMKRHALDTVRSPSLASLLPVSSKK